MALLNVFQVAEEIGCSPVSLYSRAFRQRIGLVGIKFGRNIRFDERDLAKLLKSNREKLPEKPKAESEDDMD